jgi:hypothetical protein
MRERNSSNLPDDPIGGVVIWMGVIVILIPLVPALVLGWGLYLGVRKLSNQVFSWILIWLMALACCLALYFFFNPMSQPENPLNLLTNECIREIARLQFRPFMLLSDLFPVWVLSLLLIPLVAGGFAALMPKSVQQKALEASKHRERREQKTSQRAARRLACLRAPDQINRDGVLGLPISGDLPWTRRGWFVLPTQELLQHAVCVGASGMGKTETLLRIAVFVARTLRWQVIYVDGKGDDEAGRRFVALMRESGIEQVKLFPEEEYYDGWRGDRLALLNRLLALQDYSEEYYETVAENFLSLALRATPQLPRRSEELLERLELSALYSFYGIGIDADGKRFRRPLRPGHTKADVDYLEKVSSQVAAGVYSRYRAFFQKVGGALDGTWSFDDVDAAYLRLDGLALRKTASSLARYLVEDFANYSGSRKPKQRRALFIFDDIGAVNVDLSNLFERVRFRGVSIVTSAQTYEGLGYRSTRENAKRILGAATTLILHGCSDPSELIARAGTRKGVDAGYSFSGDEATGSGMMRAKNELRVDPDVVRQLPVGEAFVIAHGKTEHIRIAPIEIDVPPRKQGKVILLIKILFEMVARAVYEVLQYTRRAGRSWTDILHGRDADHHRNAEIDEDRLDEEVSPNRDTVPLGTGDWRRNEPSENEFDRSSGEPQGGPSVVNEHAFEPSPDTVVESTIIKLRPTSNDSE